MVQYGVVIFENIRNKQLIHVEIGQRRQVPRQTIQPHYVVWLLAQLRIISFQRLNGRKQVLRVWTAESWCANK